MCTADYSANSGDHAKVGPCHRPFLRARDTQPCDGNLLAWVISHCRDRWVPQNECHWWAWTCLAYLYCFIPHHHAWAQVHTPQWDVLLVVSGQGMSSMPEGSYPWTSLWWHRSPHEQDGKCHPDASGKHSRVTW